jgi:hypothetical protein
MDPFLDIKGSNDGVSGAMDDDVHQRNKEATSNKAWPFLVSSRKI